MGQLWVRRLSGSSTHRKVSGRSPDPAAARRSILGQDTEPSAALCGWSIDWKVCEHRNVVGMCAYESANVTSVV